MRGATSTPNAGADSRCCTGGKHTSTWGAKEIARPLRIFEEREREGNICLDRYMLYSLLQTSDIFRLQTCTMKPMTDDWAKKFRETAFFARATMSGCWEQDCIQWNCRSVGCPSRNPLQWVGICSLHSPQTQPFHLPPGPIAMQRTCVSRQTAVCISCVCGQWGQWSVKVK